MLRFSRTRASVKRGDVTVLSVSAGLAALVFAALALSVSVARRSPMSLTGDVGSSTSSLLVVTWGPSLCKFEPSAWDCANGRADEVGRRFLLHGLWPQPFPALQFCGLPKATADRGRRRGSPDMPSVTLPEDARRAWRSTALASHEWYKHGTCSGVPPAVYFRDTAALTDQLRKVLYPVFEKAEGQRLSIRSVRQKLDDEFGEGAGRRMAFECRRDREGRVIHEVRVSLPPVADFGTAGDPRSLGELLLKGPPVPPGCLARPRPAVNSPARESQCSLECSLWRAPGCLARIPMRDATIDRRRFVVGAALGVAGATNLAWPKKVLGAPSTGVPAWIAPESERLKLQQGIQIGDVAGKTCASCGPATQPVKDTVSIPMSAACACTKPCRRHRTTRRRSCRHRPARPHPDGDPRRHQRKRPLYQAAGAETVSRSLRLP